VTRVKYLAVATVLALSISVGAASKSEAQYERGLQFLLYYYNLSEGFDDWVGFRLRGFESKSETFTSMAELVFEKRGDGSGGVGQYFFYKDLNPNLFLFGTIGLGAGKEYFTRNKIYGELNWKIPLFPNLVTVVGFGRNGYGNTWDLQPTAGLTMYANPLILQIRFFHYANSDANTSNNSFFARVDLNRFGPLDLGVQYLVGDDGYRLASPSNNPELAEFDSRVFTIDTILWTKRNKTGLMVRGEVGQRVDAYDRVGFEIGPTVRF
jgi:YaiO family outer membrane protein